MGDVGIGRELMRGYDDMVAVMSCLGDNNRGILA
jgi:hypothetical protein